MIGNRIKQLRKALKQTQYDLGDRLRIKASAISQMESNRIRPALDTLETMAKTTGVNLHWLITGRGPMFEVNAATINSPDRRLEQIRSFISEELMALVRAKEDYTAQDVIELKVTGEIAAGLPAESSDTSMDVINLRRSQINGVVENYVALRVNGHSMEPFVCHEDLVVIRCSQDWERLTGHICALRIDGAITLKRLTMDHLRKLVVLQSINEEYRPILINPLEHQDISLIGMMQYMYRKV